MSRLCWRRMVLGAVVGLFVPQLYAQWRYFQPWNQQLDAVSTRVDACGAIPPVVGRIAYDDFIIDPNDLEQGQDRVRITRVVWWGVLTHADPRQPDDFSDAPPFRIAFHLDDGADCEPAALIAERCPVVATYSSVGTDCNGWAVYRFSAAVGDPANPIELTPGHYWLSIAEVDENDGADPDEDFRWSGHRRIKNCSALQIDPWGGITRPLISTCTHERKMDLAFGLMGRTIRGSEGDAGLTAGGSGRLEFRDSSTGVMLERMTVEIDSNGVFFVQSALDPGLYTARLEMSGALPAEAPLTIYPDRSSAILFPALVQGDLTGDGCVDLADLSLTLTAYGICGP